MSFWTHAAMRGQSAWTVGERELMAAMTAKWNACPFCIGAHGAIAAQVLGKPVVETALDDFQQAELPTKLRATLTLTRRPDKLTAEDARAVLRKGVTPEALEDAIAVTVLFNIRGRCADALDYEILEARDFDRAAKRLLVQGYAFGKGKIPPIPIIVPWPMPCAGAPMRGRGRPMRAFAKRWRSGRPEARLWKYPTTTWRGKSAKPRTRSPMSKWQRSSRRREAKGPLLS